MREIIAKRQASAKTFKWVPIVLFALSVICIIIGLFGLYAILLMAAIVTLIIYLNKYRAVSKNMQWLESRKFGHIPDTFQETDLEYPKSKLRCGQFAMMAKGTMVMIPYADIAWVYMHNTKLYGIITISRQAIVACRDGYTYQFPCTQEELQEILKYHILPRNNTLMVGYSPDKQKAYKEQVKQFKAQNGL